MSSRQRVVLIALLAVAGLAAGFVLAPGRASLEAVEAIQQAPVDSRAADALRAGDCDQAAAYLTERQRQLGEPVQPPEIRLILGVYFHQCERFAESLEELQAATGYEGVLADWRLQYLSRSAEALGQLSVAQRALTDLVDWYPASPLQPAALVRAAELAFERREYGESKRLVERTRTAELEPDDDRRRLALEWKLGRELRDHNLVGNAARQLLVAHPLEAAELEVVEIFRQHDGSLDWTAFLSDEQLIQRARNLMAVELYPSAISSLENIPESRRGLDWSLLTAEATTLDQRGAEALGLLAGAPYNGPEERQLLEWRRARAALEASTARRGRTTSSERRDQFRRLAHAHLEQVAALGSDRELAMRALRILFEDRAEDERFDEALEILRAIQKIEPSDTTGARYLWRTGWREFTDRNYSGAIGYWTELAELYPLSSSSRSGRYWIARAHGRLGNGERSRELFLDLLSAGLDDFYARQARKYLSQADLDRLPPIEPTVTSEGALRGWPEDPVLTRAQLLTDLGLDQSALTELELAAARADDRASDALRARILGRQGNHRQSIITLRRVFPELGTAQQSRVPFSARRLYYPNPMAFSDIVTDNARRHALSPYLVLGMIRQESAFDAGAKSWAGARGLMQLMPSTGKELARRLGLPYSTERLSDPSFSIRLGTAYFSQVLKMFANDEGLALAGYNGGPYRIKRLWSQRGNDEFDQFLEELPMSETRNYVKRVILYADNYQRLYEDLG